MDDFWPQTMEFPDLDKITLTWLGNGYTSVEGAPGAIPGPYPVAIEGPSSTSGALTTAEDDGSFSAEIVAPPGSWVIVKYDPTPRNRWLQQTIFNVNRRTGRGAISSAAQHAPGVWAVVPFGPLDSEGVPFVVSTATKQRYLDFTLNGMMTGDFTPGGQVTLSGEVTVYASETTVESLSGQPITFWIDLMPIFDDEGRMRLFRNQFFSNFMTPTGLPVEHRNGGRQYLSRKILRIDSLLRKPLSNRLGASFSIDIPLPEGLADGTYALWLEPGSNPGSLGGVRSRVFEMNQYRIPLPLFTVGQPSRPRLNWSLLTDVLSADGSRGTVAKEEASDFQISNHIATQSHNFIIPRTSADDGESIAYRLEPFLPMLSQGRQRIPYVPPISFKLPSGSLMVRVIGPDGKVDVIGPEPFVAAHTGTPATSDGECLDCGGPHLTDVLRLSTNSDKFDFRFPGYGEYTIEMTGFVEDIYGNVYDGGGTYKIYVAKPLDLEPATLPMTPFQVGDSLNPAITVLPGVPADVTVKTTLLINSDEAQKIEYLVTGKANSFGFFSPDRDTPDIKMTGPGELLVETTASYTDDDGVLWMGATRWGQVVETEGAPIIARGRRGRDRTTSGELIWDSGRQWFVDPLPESPNPGHSYAPYSTGDILWSSAKDSAIIRITVQDTEGKVQAALGSRGLPVGHTGNGVPTLEDRIRSAALPLITFTESGLSPVLDPDGIVAHGYWYGGAQRPGERVREFLSDDQPAFGDTYWAFDENYALQPGIGHEGDEPNDFKFIFGGAVFRDETRDLYRYGIYSSLWVHLPEDDELGTRVFPPFQGANGGPSGGPIMTLAGEEIDAFVVPLAVRPGTILETGDTFSFSAHLAPTLPARVDVTVTGPDGFSQQISGRANSIGYFYEPDQDFEIKTPGVYHVAVTATFDSPTSVGPMSAPFPTGTVLGAVDQGFDVYVVPDNNPFLRTPHPLWSVVKGVQKVPLVVETPAGIIAGKIRYTIGMPGFLLESGTVDLTNGWGTIIYDPIGLVRTFPNIDTRSSRTSSLSARRALVDTVWVSVLVAADDGKFYARHFTLQGPDLYAIEGK